MMNRRIITSIVLALLALAANITAHPLGNFSINQYTRFEVSKTEIHIRQVFDMAEIPTFQASGLIDTDKNGTLSEEELRVYLDTMTPAFIAGLSLAVNDEPVALSVVQNKIWTEKGAGDLPVLKITWDIAGRLPVTAGVSTARFENRNYIDRLGWNEIVVKREIGVNIFNSTAYGSSVTEELKSYPEESLNSPLRERTAIFSITTNPVPDGAATLKDRNGKNTGPVQKDRLAELIAVPELTPAIALFSLLFAFGFGAVHAMSPGHGKTVVGAYLVGSRGTFKHAVFLGLTVTVTHTLGVFALGFITLFASNYILPERIMPFLTFVSGLLVFFIGVSLFKDRLLSALGWKQATHSHDHNHDNDDGEHVHTHDGITHTHGGTTHSHLPPKDISWKSLLGLGISGGLLPCPSALVLMLAAISLGRVGYGLLLTVVFSFGLASTLTALGLVFLYVGKAFSGTSLSENRIFKALPVMSALVIATVGAVICYSSLG